MVTKRLAVGHQLRSPTVLLAVAVAAATVLSSCSGEETRPVRLVLVTLDTLRADGLFPGPDRGSDMPNLWQRCEHGRVFTRHYSATSSTLPSHVSMFTGLHPWQHGVTRNGTILDDRIETVTERLGATGFATAAVVASFPLEHRFGLDQGFDSYSDDFTLPGVEVWAGETVPGAMFRNAADTVTDRAIHELSQLGPGNQFLWVHYFDAHSPYGDLVDAQPLILTSTRHDLRDPSRRENALENLPVMHSAYTRDVRALDEWLERLLSRLDEERARFETHIVVVADHGESFGEEGSIGHGMRLTPEQIHVPCAILSSKAPRSSCDVPTGSIDIAATLLALAGVPSTGFQGRDLTQPIEDEPVVGMRRTFESPRREIRTDGSLYPLPDPRFYLRTTIGTYIGNSTSVETPEIDRLYPPDRVREIFARYEVELSNRTAIPTVDTDVKAGLKALGYTEDSDNEAPR